MRKRILGAGGAAAAPAGEAWLDLERLAEVEITSEDPAHPIESALLPGAGGTGWRAAGPGVQTIRLRFAAPQRLRRIRLRVVEREVERGQELVLAWSAVGGEARRQIVRQQWTFSPSGSTEESEDYRVDLGQVATLELTIVPDRSGGEARASLASLRLA